MSRVVHQIEVELSKKQNAGSYGYIFYLPNVTELRLIYCRYLFSNISSPSSLVGVFLAPWTNLIPAEKVACMID